MPIVLIGNSFKYEIESICKLFFHTARFNFTEDISEAQGDSYIITEKSIAGNEMKLQAEVRLNGDTPEKEEILLPENTEKSIAEQELCRLIYHILCRKTGITPPWGLMTGIRPVKKVTELMAKGLSREEIENTLRKRYELSDSKLSLAYETAVNQQPILDSIDTSAASLYVSIPFCPTRCSYCSFVSHSMASAMKLMPQYIDALCRELEIIGRLVKECDTKIDTIYFGGGTPTSISAEDIRRVMEAVAANFDLDRIREYSFEAGRPDTITEEKLRVIKELGADRISVNPQTLNDDVLKVIGRQHTVEQIREAFALAREVGFTNINMDLIIGLTGENAEDVEETLRQIGELQPDSVTVHTLALKRAARLNIEKEQYQGMEAVQVCDMLEATVRFAKEQEYAPYYLYRQKNMEENLENVGYAREGKEGLYNILIMEEKHSILALGAGGATKLVLSGGERIERSENVKSLKDYLERTDEMIERKKLFFEQYKGLY